MKLDSNITVELKKLRNDEFLTKKEEIIKKLSSLLVDAVKKRTSKKPIAIAFSGGIDSVLLTFICEKLKQPFSLYTVGLENSKDMISAKAVAKEMNWELTTKIYEIENLEPLFKEVIDITKKRDVVTVGVGSVTLAVLKLIKENIVFTGLGSEEIFAGYERHKGDIHEACWEGLLNIYDRDIVRDSSLAKHYNKETRLPFLDKDLIEYGIRIHPTLKVADFKKQILREAAVNLGLPKEIAFRKKCAAQYGSKFDFALQKLAKQKGMLKKEYLSKL
jgi:asparagine synthetase B (glutamine-hydrolysing)